MRSLNPCAPLYAAALLASVLLLTSCENLPSVLAPLEQPKELQAAPPRISGAIPSGRDQLPALESPGTTSRAARGGAQPASLAPPGDITLNFADTDIREIVRVILGDTLKANYTIDPGVQGTATLSIARPLSRAELLPTLETLLNQNGATLTQREGIYRISPLSVATAATPVAAGAFGSGTQIVPLRYASAAELAKLLEPYISEGGKITAAAGRNALIISGDPNVRQALSGMIQAFDIDLLAGQSYALFPAGNGNAEKLASEFEPVLQSQGEAALGGVVRVVPMQRVNAVLVVSNQPRYLAEARRFFGLERRAEDATTRSWHVYYVQNGQSADLENLLQRAFTPGRVSPTAVPAGVTFPGSEPALMVGGRAGSGLAGLGQTSGLGNAAGRGPGAAGDVGERAAADQAAAKRETSGPGVPALSTAAEAAAEPEDHIRVIANRRNNALLIYATPREYAVIEGMLRKVDIIPLQVLIEATIAEVTLNDKLNYGTQFHLGGKLSGTLSAAASGDTPAVATVAGIPIGYAANFPGFVLNNGAREVINALAAVTNIKVLSAPEVMVLDNEPARLQVGSIVPVLTQSQQSTISPNAPIVNSVDYRDTGVILVVVPRVNSGGLVTLDLSQEVSDVLSETTGNINSPTFNQRLIRTRVAVQDGQTVGLAGLIRDSDTQDNSGVPVLKDIPLLGSLVSSQTNQRDRTELLLLITPHVVRDQRDARALTEDLRGTLTNAGLVRQQLQAKPPHGSANPNGL